MPSEPSKDAGPVVQWSAFVVNEKPRCMWGFDLRKQSEDFLLAIDTSIFLKVAESQSEFLEGEGRQQAAVALRTNYGHALETFFALLAAAIQAPHCPLGWILQYAPGDVPKIIRKIHQGERILAHMPLPATDRWAAVSATIHSFRHDDPDEDVRIKRLFTDTWTLLAHDYLDDVGSDEFNSIKHGLRVKPGGFSLQIGVPPDQKAPPLIDSKSEFGTRFFHRESLGDGINFYAKEAARNWSPKALAIRTELLCVSIDNVVSFLLLQLGGSAESVRFHWPVPIDQPALELAWKQDFIFQSMIGGAPIELAPAALLKTSEILAAYSQPEVNDG